MTQLEYARNNKITPEMKLVASSEGLRPNTVRELISKGLVVIPKNNTRHIKKPCGIGKHLSTKINANIGTSTDKANIKEELKKLKIAVEYGSDAVMDLSVGGDLKQLRKTILKFSPVPVGTVPVYEIAVCAQDKKRNFLNFNKYDILDVLEEQARQGVDFFTLHSGITLAALDQLKRQKRVLDIVSRGGAIIAGWMSCHKKENPFYEYFDEILDIASKFDVTISLGDGLRPGSVLDATDQAQIAELKTLGKLALRAKQKNVQVMIEGPGHVPLNQIKENILLQKKYCHNAPFYVLGPLVTDIAPGYDHITGAIGGALAASYGADFLCYVTPAEHLRHPTSEDVKEGVIASKIAAHAADIAKNVKGAVLKDKRISQARKKRDWKKQISLAIDPKKAKEYRLSSLPRESSVCTMCGKYCSIKLMEECMRA